MPPFRMISLPIPFGTRDTFSWPTLGRPFAFLTEQIPPATPFLASLDSHSRTAFVDVLPCVPAGVAPSLTLLPNDHLPYGSRTETAHHSHNFTF